MGDAGQPRCFFVSMRGEGVDDHGGPYRAAYQTSLGEEVTQLLDLLTLCPNGQAGDFENRDKVLFNTQLMQKKQWRKLYTFMGKLLGVACRHNIQVPLDFPPLIWKSLCCEAVSDFDLYSIDTHTMNLLRMVKDGESESPRELFEQMLSDMYARGHTTVKPQLVRELINVVLNDTEESDENEKAVRLQRLVEILEHLHMTTQSEGCRLLLCGLSSSIPSELLPIFSGQELEMLLAGAGNIDLNVLKMATEYDGVAPDDKHIEYFWQAMEGLSQKERSQFVNFCSGRSRLPPSAAAFPMTFKLQGPNPSARDEPDKYLPVAATCFFSLSLPHYSSAEIMAKRIRYAIGNTELMDADVLLRTADGWDI
jgi:hypothetical protein